MNRRRFLVSSLGVGTLPSAVVPCLRARGAATDDELAFANFGASTEFLVKDFYAKALEAKLLPKAGLCSRKARSSCRWAARERAVGRARRRG